MLSTTTLALAAVAALISSPSLVQAKIDCDTSLGTFYPYCINIPDGAQSGQNFPTIVFLSGSGARGPPSRVRELSGFDGDGKLVNQYYSGNKGAAQTMAATKFVVVTPILPMYANGQEQRHYFPENLDKLYQHLKNKGYPIDWDRLHLGGFSMGGRGVCRNGVARPELYASLSPAAGACEEPGTGTLSQQKATSTLDKVSAMKNIPLRQYAGRWDNTVGQSSPKKMQEALDKCGASNAKLIWVDGNHNDMSTKPFSVDRLEWMLQQRRGGGGGSNNDNVGNNDNKQVDKDEKKENKEVLSPDDTGKGNNASEGRFNVDLGKGANQQSEPSSSTPSNDSPAPSSDAAPSASASASPSPSKGGKCKRQPRSKKAKTKRSSNAGTSASPQKVKRGLRLSDIIASTEKKVEKRSPLESLKAHAGNRRSSHGSTFGSKLSR